MAQGNRVYLCAFFRVSVLVTISINFTISKRISTYYASPSQSHFRRRLSSKRKVRAKSTTRNIIIMHSVACEREEKKPKRYGRFGGTVQLISLRIIAVVLILAMTFLQNVYFSLYFFYFFICKRSHVLYEKKKR